MDLELIKKCIKEDRRSQEEFYRLCYGMLIRVCCRYTSDKEQAIFFLNTGFVRILLNLKQYKSDVPFEYWAKRVMINSILNELKKDKKQNEKFVLTDDISLYISKEIDEESLSESEKIKIELIKSKAEKLPPMTRKVFDLYAIDGYLHHEIANMLGINENTSMWHYSEAKKKIKAMIEVN